MAGILEDPLLLHLLWDVFTKHIQNKYYIPSIIIIADAVAHTVANIQV